MYHLTREQLLADLHAAFTDAKRHKSKKAYVKRFEQQLERNLQVLCDELWNRTYQARPSTCFIIHEPKKREVFAAEFRDRIVHHLYYNYTHELFERTFIRDSYSCIPKRGTHDGILRLQQHIRQESLNYIEKCFVLKMDISGYFMHINRERLLEIALSSLGRMATHRVMKRVPMRWLDMIDMDFVSYLTREIVLLNPTENCHIVGDVSEWNDLPYEKSLFHSPAGCGLPIGNLTSQLFSNVYLNELDQFIKRELHCKHYGRYVDDFYIVSADKISLLSYVDRVRAFLEDKLHLQLHEGKVFLCPVQYGTGFLGMYIKPWRLVVLKDGLLRMGDKMNSLYRQQSKGLISLSRWATAVSSFRGILTHGYSKYIEKNFEL